MTTWSLKTGASLLIPSGPALGQMHLHVVLNDPKPMEGFGNYACALACFCSVPTTGIPYEQTREFAANSHPFIVHQTYVSYRHFQVLPAQHIIQCVKTGTYVPKSEAFPVADVQSIIDGYRESGRVQRYLKGLPL